MTERTSFVVPTEILPDDLRDLVEAIYLRWCEENPPERFELIAMPSPTAVRRRVETLLDDLMRKPTLAKFGRTVLMWIVDGIAIADENIRSQFLHTDPDWFAEMIATRITDALSGKTPDDNALFRSISINGTETE